VDLLQGVTRADLDRDWAAAGPGNWSPAGEKHWHGTMPTTAVPHIAITEALANARPLSDWSILAKIGIGPEAGVHRNLTLHG
jgi:hypothetical protein